MKKCPKVTNTKKIFGKTSSHEPTIVNTQDLTNCVKIRNRAAEKPEKKIKNF